MDTVAEEASGADSIAVRPESKISVKTEEPLNQQEIERRREIVRRFFNDFWKSSDDKPATFAERLNRETRMCRFPASGSSWESLARGGVPMDNSRRWQRAALEECSERRQWSRLPRSRRDSHFCQILATW